MRSKLWCKKLPASLRDSNRQKFPRCNYARVTKIRTMFESFFARFAQVIPRVKADDEDLIDPQQVLRQNKKKNEEHPDNSSNPKPTSVNNNKEELKNTITNLENIKKIETNKIKNVANKDENAEGTNENGNGDSDLVDPMDTLREKCREHRHAVTLAKKYEDCNARVSSRSQTSETCVEELFDLLHAIDHCVTEKLFSQLK